MPQPRVVAEQPQAPEAVMPTGEPSRVPRYLGIVAIIVAALAAYEFGFNSPPSSRVPAEQSPAPQVEPAPGSPAASGASAPASGLAGAPAVPAPPASGAPLDPALSAPAAAARAPAPGERELHFRFEIESWVEIRDRNDKVIFSKLNRAGSEERVSGTPPLKLVVGNARGVRLTYGEQVVDLSPHIGVTVARLTLQ